MPEMGLSTLPVLLALIVPGFVWWTVHQYLQVTRREQKQTWIGMFTRSAINFALWFWMIPGLWADTAQVIQSHLDPLVPARSMGFRVPAQWFLVTFVSPLLCGFVTGLAQRKGSFRRVLIDRVGLNVPHAVEAAWDYRFGDTVPLWVSATLTDGSVVEGIFGDKSLASSAPGERDLYLERYFERDGDDLVAVDNDGGIWIRADMIKAISFRHLQPKRESNEEQQDQDGRSQ